MSAVNEQQSSTKTTQKASNYVASTSILGMSTSEFMNYFYNTWQNMEAALAQTQNTSSNKTSKNSSVSTANITNKTGNSDKSDNESTEISFPKYVRFRTHVIDTTNKSMDEIVKAFKKYYPGTSSTKIISTLTQKYCGSSSDNTNVASGGLNFNA